MFTCEMFQVCNHSVLISSLGMGFGHRNGMGFGHRWTENIKRKIRKGKVWTPKSSSRVCSVHFKDGQPTNKNLDPTEDLGYNFNSKVVGGKRKNPLDRSKIIPEKKPRKAKKSCEEVSEVLENKKYPITRTHVCLKILQQHRKPPQTPEMAVLHQKQSSL